MSNRIATGEVTQERLDELAMGKPDKNGKRRGGFIGAARKMKQNQEAMAIGAMSEDDLIEKAYAMAWNYLKRTAAAAGEDDLSTADEEDEAYRAEREERYRQEYEWDEANANDDASLTMLLDLEVEQRRLKRDLQRAHIPWKERTELLGELRQLANTHANLQKSLQMDRATRDSRKRNADPMEEMRRQIESGASRMQALIDEWRDAAPTAQTIEELRALMKHHSGLPYSWIDTTLAAHRRVLGIAVPSDSTGVET